MSTHYIPFLALRKDWKLYIWLLMNLLNIPFFFCRLVYRHGLVSDIFQTKSQEKKSFLD